MSSIFSQRSSEIEIMDNLNCEGEVVNQTLQELELINRTLGGNQITLSGVNELIKEKTNSPLRIVDLGCGGGDMLMLLAKRFARKNLRANFIGFDANPSIIEYAKRNAKVFSNIEFEAINILTPEFQSKTFDIAVATLFFHHFTSEQLVNIIKKLYTQSRVGIVINDLHRHLLAFYSIKLLTKFFSKSTMVKFDAPLSVLRGFSRKEIEDILHQSGIKNYSLHWRWAFRWQIIIKKS